MASLSAFVHPGAHPHPHGSDWLAVIADNPFIAIAIAAGIAIAFAVMWRTIARRG